MKKIFSILMAVCGFYFAQGQNADVISSVDLQVNSGPNNDINAAPGPDGYPLPVYVALLRVNFSDPSAVSRIQVKLGSSASGSDFLNRTFEFSEAGVSENGSSFVLQGNMALMTFGMFEHQGTYYTEVKAQLNDGSWTPGYGDSGP